MICSQHRTFWILGVWCWICVCKPNKSNYCCNLKRLWLLLSVVTIVDYGCNYWDHYGQENHLHSRSTENYHQNVVKGEPEEQLTTKRQPMKESVGLEESKRHDQSVGRLGKHLKWFFSTSLHHWKQWEMPFAGLFFSRQWRWSTNVRRSDGETPAWITISHLESCCSPGSAEGIKRTKSQASKQK